MSKQVTHIIHKLNLDIEVPDSKIARKMYQQAGDLLQRYVLPRLEELLKQYESRDIHVRLDKLDVNFDAFNLGSLEEKIKIQLAEAILKELDNKLKSLQSEDDKKKETVQFRNRSQSIIEAFIWFLENGTLPWWFDERSVLADSGNIIDAITDDEDRFIVVFRKMLEHNPIALRRLLRQYDVTLLTYLFSLLMPLELLSTATQFEEKFIASLEESGVEADAKLWYWQSVWTLYSMPQLLLISNSELEEKLEHLISLAPWKSLEQDSAHLWMNTDIDEDVSQTINIGDESEEIATEDADMKLIEEEDGLIGSNAGLILLHPFLQYFFLELGLLDGDKFKNRAAKNTAVHLLHYLATGEEHAPDYDLLFEKYLCSVQLKAITNRHEQLTEKMKSEAHNLLQSVIKHWPVLKNTSVEGLRESFLQRKGKLVINGNGHKIIMEHNTLDILLQQISWNVSLLKLPWMNQLIHVEWIN